MINRLNQVATYWESQEPNGFGGRLTGPATPIKCRWEDKSVRYAGRLDHQEEISKAVVFVDREMNVGDWLFLGPTSESDPTTLEGAHQIRKFERVPDLRNLNTLLMAIL